MSDRKIIDEDMANKLLPLRFDGLEIYRIEKGKVELKMEILDEMKNYIDILHGGMSFTMSDICAGITAQSLGYKTVTLNSSINYVKAGTGGTIYAVGEVVHGGRTTVVVDVKVLNEEREVLTKGTFTMFILEKSENYDYVNSLE